MRLFGGAGKSDEDRWQEPLEDEELELDEDAYDEDDEAYGEDYDEDYDEEYDELEDDGEKRGFFARLTSTQVGFLAALLTVVVLAGAGALVVNYFLSLVNYQAADSEYFATVQPGEALPSETAPISEHIAKLEEEDKADTLEATPEELAQWDEHIENVVSDKDTYEIPFDQDVYNILLIGTDVRELTEVGRSDTMILVSINQNTESVYLTSFLRDCYVYIPGYGNTRLNHAFAYGGPDLLEQTLEENFKVHVDRYVAVNFFSFMDVVDTLGGIWLYVSEEEQEVTNDYIWSMNKLMDEEWSTDYLWSAGWHKMNGKQTLCYARNRYVGNDYARSQRQRTVLNQIFNGAKTAPASTLVQLAQVILPQVTTDLSKTQVLSYAANFGAYSNYNVISQQIPIAGTYSGATINGMSVISLDLDANINYLQGTIYAGQDAQTADDFADEDEDIWANYDPNEFWGRSEWANIDFEKVDFSKVDWYTIDYDTVDWTEYYYDEEETASPSTSAAAQTSAKPAGTSAATTSAKPTASTKPTATPKPSPSPTREADEEG